LRAEQLIKAPIDDVWAFFSEPNNLSQITPPHMKFKITSGKPEAMHPGQIISYKVSVLHGFPTNWVTEITQVKLKKYFIDNQLFGPYKLWHHQHIFEEVKTGVLMKDIVTFKLPMGFIGNIAIPMVKKQLFKIFSYRNKVTNEIFD